MKKTNPGSSGFTLIELLVVLMIFSLLALMSYRGLGTVLDTRERVRLESAKWHGVSAFFSRFEHDVQLAAPRPIRTLRTLRTASGLAPAWRGDPGAAHSPYLEFSRFAAADGVDAAHRLAYTLNNNQEIELWLWSGLDVAPAAVPQRYPVLTGVQSVDLKYLGSGVAWLDTWPAPGHDSELPRAVQLRIVLVSGEEILRVITLQ